MTTIDGAFDRAKLLIAEVEPRLNQILTEEDAKLQLVVRFITEVLGWKHGDISAERKNDNGYSDYTVSDAGRLAFLIEAKRQGRLPLATTAKIKQAYRISGPALKGSIDAIEQAASYCAPEGIQLAIVTDGSCWIFFKPFIPGVSYKSKEAIVFPTLPSILEDFATFYELASKVGHSKGLYKQLFDKLHDSRVLLSTPLHAPFTDADIHPEHKTPLAFDLDRIFVSYFSGLAGDTDPEMLVECFVETRESRIADFALEKLATYVLGNIAPPDRTIDDGLRELIANSISEKDGETVFIIGPSGAGKSTFLERFFRKTLPRSIREKCVPIKIDALDATGNVENFQSWCTNASIAAIEKQLYEKGYPGWDELLGLYHGEYIRRSEGVDAELYRHDKEAFKRKFGEYMDTQVERDREGYLRRLLTDIVENRKRLPIFVIDNTDEFSLDYKKSIFQYFQALRRHATHCLLLFAVTDRSAWSFSKTEIFNIYSSRSYFLPTPPPREIFRRRLNYMKAQIKPAGRTGGTYDAGVSFKVRLDNLEAFASAIEDILVAQDYVANRLGSLANYNIRKTLGLARRVMTSASLGVEDLIKSYLTGRQEPLSPDKFMRALVLGDFNLFKRGDAHSVFPVFDVDGEINQSPLINIRVLSLLKAAHDARTSDDARYLGLPSIAQYFDVFGYTEAAVAKCLLSLLAAGLVEPHDPSIGELSLAQRLAITYSGLAHLEMGSFNPTFFELLALTTPLVNAEVSARIRSAHLASSAPDVRQTIVRQVFSSYLLDEDERFGRMPDSEQYNIQRLVTENIRRFGTTASNDELIRRDAVTSAAQPGIIAKDASGIVEWFDAEKGYGFVSVEDLGESAFLHASVVFKAGIGSVHDGDPLVVEVSRGKKGIVITNVQRALKSNPNAVAPVDVVVIKTFGDRGYGFVYVPTLRQDAYFRLDLLPPDVSSTAADRRKLQAEINVDPRGRGLQVRRFV